MLKKIIFSQIRGMFSIKFRTLPPPLPLGKDFIAFGKGWNRKEKKRKEKEKEEKGKKERKGRYLKHILVERNVA